MARVDAMTDAMTAQQLALAWRQLHAAKADLQIRQARSGLWSRASLLAVAFITWPLAHMKQR